MNILRLPAIAAALLLSLGAAVQAQTTLRIGLAEDADVLDPSIARTYVGRIVFASLCDKLFDIDEKLNIVPADGGFSPTLEKLVAAFSGGAEGLAAAGVDQSGTPAAVV